jgi:DNA polymerase-1
MGRSRTKKKDTTSQINLPLEYHQTEEWPRGYYQMADLNLSQVWGKVVGLDIETRGLNPYDPKTAIVSISVSVNGRQYATHIRDADFKLGLSKVRRIVESDTVMLVQHNIKYDLKWMMYKLGWKPRCMVYDTKLAAYFLDENDIRCSLEDLCDRYDVMPGYKSMIEDKGNIEAYNKEDVKLYNMKDSLSAVLLKEFHLDGLLAQDNLSQIMNIGCQVIPVLADMEARGVPIDMVYAKQQQMKLYEQLLDLKLGLKDIAGEAFSPDSPKQLGRVLFGTLGFTPVMLTAKGSDSVNAESLIRIRQEQTDQKGKRHIAFMNTLLKYNELAGLNEKYYGKLHTWIEADGCVHCNYNIGWTTTGRLSCNSPNMQQQRRGSEFRGVFASRPGYVFLEGDFSQVELRFAAWFAQEKRMLRMFDDGLDIHTATLCEMIDRDYDEVKAILKDHTHVEHQFLKNLRVAIKNVNFGEMYGASPWRLQRELIKNGIYWSIEECKDLFNGRKALFPNIVKWKKRMEKIILAYKCIRMPFGQLRRLPYASDDWQDELGKRGLRQGINFMIQSTASAWIPMIGMILLKKYLDENPWLGGCTLLQVHDSILCEVRLLDPKTMERVKRDIRKIMEVDILDFIQEVFKLGLNVPLEFECEYMDRWR